MHTSTSPADLHNTNANRANILVDAARQFSNNPTPDRQAIEQFKSLFYGMARDVGPSQMRLISAMLSRCVHLPAQVAYYLALGEFEIAAPVLLLSPVLKNADLLKMTPKLSDEKLAVVARRSDITVEMAHHMVARNSKLICRALNLNPVFRLNSIVEEAELGKAPASVPSQDGSKTAKARDELIAIAKRAKSISKNRLDKEAPNVKPIPVRLLEAIQAGSSEEAKNLLGQQSGLPQEKLSRLINADRPEGIVVLLKGLRYSKAHTSQIMLKLSPWASRSVRYYNSAMQVYQNTPPSQCTEILQALGIQLDSQPVATIRSTQLGQLAHERRRQFDRRQTAALFGKQKLAG